MHYVNIKDYVTNYVNRSCNTGRAYDTDILHTVHVYM
jgi:hypothetical protein